MCICGHFVATNDLIIVEDVMKSRRLTDIFRLKERGDPLLGRWNVMVFERPGHRRDLCRRHGA